MRRFHHSFLLYFLASWRFILSSHRIRRVAARMAPEMQKGGRTMRSRLCVIEMAPGSGFEPET
jgi:hypothetical protein